MYLAQLLSILEMHLYQFVCCLRPEPMRSAGLDSVSQH